MYKVEYSGDENSYGEWRGKLTITYDNGVSEYYDSSEPEDASFGRHYSWIESELRRAYSVGYSDGIKDASSPIHTSMG